MGIFSGRHYPKDVILWAVRWYCRYGVSYRDLEEMLTERLLNRGKTSGRADDNAETIRKRLEVYHSQTAPLAAWYATEGKLHAIKGYGALEEINAALCGVIDNV